MEKMYELEVDAKQMCRACLSRNSEMGNLFCSEIVDGDIVPMPDVYETVTGIQTRMDDAFPNKLCEICKHKLTEAYIIRQKCIKSMALLRKILNIAEEQPIMNETPASETSPNQRMIEQNLEEMFAESEDDAEVDYIEEFEEPEDKKYESDGGNYLLTNENVNIDTDTMEVIILRDDNIIKTEEFDLEDGTDAQLTTHSTVCMELQVDPKTSVESAKVKTKRKGDKECCEICRLYICKDEMDAHMMDHDEFLPTVVRTDQFYRCDNCRIIYTSADEFIQHLSDTNVCGMVAKRYTDAHCTDYQFLDDPIESNLAGIPIIAGKMSPSNAFVCFCEFETFEFDEFSEHFKDDHLLENDELLPFFKDTCRLSHTCGVCLNRFDNMKDAIFHVYMHRNQFQCPINPCRKILFNTLLTLRRHIERDHSDNLLYFCQHCKTGFTEHESLKTHMKSECSERNLSCKHCDKRYFHKQALQMHMRNHRNDKKFKCDKCPKEFVQSNDLRNHLRTHTGERPYQCGICGKSFKTISCRLDHLKTHDNDAVVECKICHKTFKSDRILRGHMRLHSEKSFECEYCSKKFFRQYHLKTHMKVHQDVFIKNEID